MKKDNIRKDGNLLLGISFLILSALVTRTGNGTDAMILFLMAGILFVVGTGLKITTYEKHDYIRNLPSALLVSGSVFLLDLFLKWLSLEIHTFQSFGSVFFQVVTLYPIQPLDEMWYRSFDSAGLLFFTLLLANHEKENGNISSADAFLQIIGDNLPCFLTADILVSTYPIYWFGNHPGLMRIIMNLIMGICLTSVRNSFLRVKDPVNQKLWDVLQKFTERFRKPEEILYLIAVGSLFFYNFINTTVIPDNLIQMAPEWLDYLEVLNMPMIILAGMTAFLSVFEAEKKEEKVIVTVCLILGFVFYGHSQIGSVYSMFLLTAGGCHKKADRILKVVFTEGVVIMLSCMLGIQSGLLQDEINNGVHAMGMVSAVQCYAHWFFLFGMYALIRKGKFHWYEYVVSFAWMTYVFRVTTVKTGYGCFLLVLIFMLGNQYVWKKNIPSSLEKAVSWSYVIFISVYLVTLINPDLWKKFPTIWQEITYGKTGITAYPPGILDQIISDYGNGLSVTPAGQIFVLDNSYLRILLEYGIVVSGYLLLMNTWFLKQAGKENDRILLIVLGVTAFYALFQPFLADYWYNILIILPLADFSFLQTNLKA